MQVGYKFALDTETNSLYAAQITSENYLSGIASLDYFKVSQEIFLVSSLNNVVTSGAGLYIDTNGETQYFDGQSWIETSHKVVTTITDNNTNDDTIPTTKAVSAYVSTQVPTNIQLTGTIIGSAEFNGTDVDADTRLGMGSQVGACPPLSDCKSWQMREASSGVETLNLLIVIKQSEVIQKYTFFLKTTFNVLSQHHV